MLKLLGFEPHVTNNPLFAGQQATTKELFGDYSRYALYAVHTRFDRVQWFVADAEAYDAHGVCPAIIRQEDTRAAALAGLVD